VSTDELITKLRTLGVKLWADGDKLRFRAPKGSLTEELVTELAREKSAVLTWFRQNAPGGGTTESRVVPVQRNGELPLSFAQQRLWFLDQFAGTGTQYNVVGAVHLEGAFDRVALERAVNEVVVRHEALRTTFATADRGPYQRIAEALEVEFPVADLSGMAADERETRAKELAGEEYSRPFDLQSGPLFRARLLRLAEEEHVFVFAMHHIVSDGWSMGVLFHELGVLYEAYSAGRPSPLEALPIQYADFAVWQREWLSGEVLEAQLSYWKERLGGLPTLQLPTDRTRPPVQTFAGARRVAEIPGDLRDSLEALGRAEGATLFMTMLAAFAVLLQRYSGQDDIVVGSPIANRNRSEIEGLIGFFANSLVMRADVSGEPSFRELLGRVREAALGAYEHQDLPFEKLVEELEPERDMSRNPLFQVSFAVQNAPMGALQLGGLRLDMLQLNVGTTHFDLEVHVREEAEVLNIGFIYNTDLFEGGTIERMLGHYRRILEGVVAEPERRVSELELLSAEERRRLLVEWNDTATDYPRERCVHELFEEQAGRTPEAVAVVYEGEGLSYGELNSRANYLAHELRGRGVGPEVLVGICVERSLEMVVGLLGILKAGGAYVPLDPEYPAQRLSFMLEDTSAPVLLTQRALLDGLPSPESEVVCLDELAWPVAGGPSENPTSGVKAGNLAYVIYTSGSTGKPKGVMVPHRAIIRLVCNTDYFQVVPEDRVAQASNVSFDAATFEVWGALLNGARLVGVGKDVQLDPEVFAGFLSDRGITALFVTTALFNLMAREAPTAFAGLRGLMFGGEAVDAKAVRRVLEHGPPERLLHVYGPTESTTFASWQRVEAVGAEATTVPIGRPVRNTTLYVLDELLEPVPVGVPGELYIGGDGLARGYLKRPELTAEKFVPDPFATDAGARLYKTGDRVRYRDDGAIEFLGRTDEQVKLRGFRVELGEIEAVLGGHEAVREVVVVVREDTQGDKRVVAYTVTPGEAPPAAELRELCRRELPSYMVPSAFVRLDSIPLNPNGNDELCPHRTGSGQRSPGIR